MTIRSLLGTLVIFDLVGLVGLAGCGDDSASDDATASGSTRTSAAGDEPTQGPPTGDPTSTSSTGDPTTGAGDTGDTGDAPITCDALPLPDALVQRGTWDSTLTIAGFAGVDGLTPGVHDLARDAGGALLAVGYFHYIGSEAAPPFSRLEADVWGPEPSLTVALDRPTISAIAAFEHSTAEIDRRAARPTRPTAARASRRGSAPAAARSGWPGR